MGIFKKRRLLRDGLEATGVVTSTESRAVHDDGEQGSVPTKLWIVVRGDGRPEREVVLKLKLKRGRYIGRGTKLLLRADREDPTEIAIDWDATDALHANGEGLFTGMDGTDVAKFMGMATTGKLKGDDLRRASEELADDLETQARARQDEAGE